MTTTENAKKTIEMSEAIRTYWDNELPKRHKNYPIIHMGEDSGPPPPEDKKLREFLRSLPPEEIYKLTLIMYLGRGDFPTGELTHEYKEIVETFEKPEFAVSQMMGKAPLAEYLTDGLFVLKAGNVDIDNWHYDPKPEPAKR